MKSNMGELEGIMRIDVGCLLICATIGDWVGNWGWIGLLPLLTGWSRHCPLYRLVGIARGWAK